MRLHRLFLSAEPPPLLERQLPISLLQNSIKLTNEPPEGLKVLSLAGCKQVPLEFLLVRWTCIPQWQKAACACCIVSQLRDARMTCARPLLSVQANLKRAYSQFTEDILEGCAKQAEFRAIVFALCYFHAALLERKKFGVGNLPGATSGALRRQRFSVIVILA